MIFEIKDFLSKNNNFDEINVPWRFLFKNKFLKGTVWGGNDKRKRIILNRRNVTFLPYVHRGIQYNKENPLIVNLASKHFIKHYWSDSISSYLPNISGILKRKESPVMEIRNVIPYLKKSKKAWRFCMKV